MLYRVRPIGVFQPCMAQKIGLRRSPKRGIGQRNVASQWAVLVDELRHDGEIVEDELADFGWVYDASSGTPE